MIPWLLLLALQQAGPAAAEEVTPQPRFSGVPQRSVGCHHLRHSHARAKPSAQQAKGPVCYAGHWRSDDAIREAVSTRGLFNAIDPETGWKIDFILRKDRPFSFLEFERRREIQFLGLSLSVARAEDVVVAKLEWAKLGDSERQIRDVAEIVAVQGDALDIIQIERWAEELGVRSQWQKVLEMNRPGDESV